MNRIKDLRRAAGYSQQQLANLLYVNQTAVSQWERGITTPNNDTLLQLCEIFNTTTDNILGRHSAPSPVQIPVLGEVRAGLPLEVVENILDYEEISAEMARGGEFFALRVVGDSMEPRIRENDVVIVRKQPDIGSGEIGIVLVNGDAATIKKVVKHSDGISLIAYNPSVYSPHFYTRKEIATLPITIIGKVVELRAKF